MLTRSLTLAIALGAVLTGCKAKPAPDSGFLDDSRALKRNPNIPFNKGHWDRSVSQQKFTEIYVAPVNTKYVLAQNIWEKSSAVQVSEEQVKSALAEIAVYTQEAFKKAA